MRMLPDLTEKIAVITGGSGVLGTLFAEALATAGASVAILDINEDAACQTAEEIKQKGYNAIGCKADVLCKQSLEEAAEIVKETLGECSILINGAGGNHPEGTTDNEFFSLEDMEKRDLKTFYDLDERGIRFVFDLNFIGTLLPSQIFSRQMLGKKGCSIINISSMNAFTPLTKIPAYSAAKAAISNFTQWLSVHMSKVNIRVNAIAPGFFQTSQNKTLLLNDDGSYTARAIKILNNTPMGRFGNPEELSGTLYWLIDYESSSFVNGIVVPVDGGFSAYSGV